jgi:glycosyltransferase involved in cell wall biosynthesis
MIKVGFIAITSQEWMGGYNYFKNLLFALNQLDDKSIEVCVFIGRKTDSKVKNMYRQYAEIIESSIFDRGSILWLLSKIEQKYFSTNFLLAHLLKKHDLKILSHSSINNIQGVKTINWIPDFQHIHLPDMFTKKQISQRNKNFMNIIKDSDAIVLSSKDALRDFKEFAPSYTYKTNVLHFVSQPSIGYYDLNDYDKDRLLNKYKLNDNFFYMPNQFWKHKNHLVVFKAIDQLAKSGNDVNLVCSGYLHDYRNKKYLNNIETFIKDNNLQNNITILGLIDAEDVFGLIKFSKAVINPSLFEGWSSTVEECKSVRKNMILSDIRVHKEQHPDALFFGKNNINELKNILVDYKNTNQYKITDSLEIRTRKYANAYKNIVLDISKN